MPIYEYRCGDCGKRSSRLVLAKDTSEAPVCKHCRSSRLERIMSRFAAPKSEEARLESLADPSSLGGLDENDPKSMARWMKRMGREVGEDLGEDFDQAMEEAEGGEEKSDTSGMD